MNIHYTHTETHTFYYTYTHKHTTIHLKTARIIGLACSLALLHIRQIVFEDHQRYSSFLMRYGSIEVRAFWGVKFISYWSW